MKAFQDYYPDHLNQCYGCGQLNPHGHRIRSFWDGEETICRFEPQPYHVSFPGFVYGGLIASLFDCHSIGSAAAAMYRAEGREMDTEPPFRFVTANLKVDYLKPTPLGAPLLIRSQITEVKGRKVWVASTLYAGELACARSEVLAVQMPENFLPATN